ncbi:uncharacterized protein LOC107416620 isoform X3 [Ziziphus jujuba]|uniref:Uncharacterized protein LOC107416620 isoform X3 n=1 Tax=Ziziphus jujuba TaxID=326968 RepID=A0ABM3IH63_ZIZJJ|nr:uncharacterized protein LOC107416620 isoform X3 [Ziziphus jujuba]
MLVSEQSTMAIKAYQDQAEQLLKEYVLADSFVPYISVVGGILACKMVYDLTQLISSIYFKSYSNLSRMQGVEWNNRAISTIHAVFITVLSLYFVFWSDLFSDYQLGGLVTLRTSPLSTFVLGVSIGYFLADIGMIFWFYPALGGLEYVVHHLLSVAALTYAMLTGEGQLYTYMVLISETTTPGINLRWLPEYSCSYTCFIMSTCIMMRRVTRFNWMVTLLQEQFFPQFESWLYKCIRKKWKAKF